MENGLKDVMTLLSIEEQRFVDLWNSTSSMKIGDQCDLVIENLSTSLKYLRIAIQQANKIKAK